MRRLSSHDPLRSLFINIVPSMASNIASPADVERALAGMDFPADKEDLLRHARETGASADILDTLEGLPDGTYRSPADISKAMGNLA